MHLLIVDAHYYDELLDELLKGATAALDEEGATYDVIRVPGGLEIPGAIAMADMSGRYDGYVALGVVIRGETTHYETVANESARAIMDLTVNDMLCIGNGILTVENGDQAWARARVDEMNKGAGAARAAVHMIRHKAAMSEKA